MRNLIATVVAAAALATAPARADEEQLSRRLHVAPFAGAFVATGAQRHVLDDAVLTGLTLSYDLHPYLSVVNLVAWSPSQSKGLARNHDVDLVQYDIGLQGQYPIEIGYGFTVKPFTGLGIGARTYSFRRLDVENETDFATYFALGAEVDHGSLTFSLTARDYLTVYDGMPMAVDAQARNDLALFASFGFRF
jgi:hypothetical protein